MIGFDTNVLLRALLDDDARQSLLARQHLSALTPARPGFIAVGVQLELYWVFERHYRMNREEIAGIFEALMEISSLEFESFEALVRALHLYRTTGADLSDALIAESNRMLGCVFTVTFDKQAAQAIPSMDLIK
ncbi:MAG: type II toxin-antitoxin system VapC family toxin [Alphaproteobacteria bacterium]|nr:type II toxin-antitoxin system VapC family toxin [Alphaproteobacteria bacterium]